VNRLFAMPVRDGFTQRIVRCGDQPVAPMRTLRRIQTASLRLAPNYALCIILGAYVAMQLVVKGAFVG
jgi:hypothetical protein